jgi:mannose-6-phosphate isomerase-like protein (cupin superfamily)
MRRGTLRAGVYAPLGDDDQTPHDQDELYIVACGTARFEKAGVAVEVAPQDMLFVEAGVEHRFVEISNDFATWVIFWGPPGGERELA